MLQMKYEHSYLSQCNYTDAEVYTQERENVKNKPQTDRDSVNRKCIIIYWLEIALDGNIFMLSICAMIFKLKAVV